jgi:hypothetical protein
MAIIIIIIVIIVSGDSAVGIGLAADWTFRGSNPGGGKVFCTHPDRP